MLRSHTLFPEIETWMQTSQETQILMTKSVNFLRNQLISVSYVVSSHQESSQSSSPPGTHLV